MNNPDKLRT